MRIVNCLKSVLLVSAVTLVGLAQAQSSSEEYTYDALGRLVKAKTTGGQNNNETHSICFDKSGNRTEYSSTSDGSEAPCVEIGDDGGAAAAPEPEPSPTPTPSPSNSTPMTQNDLASGECLQSVTVNLTANDSDPDGNYPLSLTAISAGSGGSASAVVISPSSVSVTFGPAGDFTSFTYTVADSLGATATGQLSVTTATCEGGPPPG